MFSTCCQHAQRYGQWIDCVDALIIPGCCQTLSDQETEIALFCVPSDMEQMFVEASCTGELNTNPHSVPVESDEFCVGEGDKDS